MPGTELIVYGLIFGSIGMGYIMYGRKQSDPVARFTGMALIFFPYIFSNRISVIAVGIFLMLVPKIAKRF